MSWELVHGMDRFTAMIYVETEMTFRESLELSLFFLLGHAIWSQPN